MKKTMTGDSAPPRALWALLLALSACGKAADEQRVTPQRMADALHAVMSADRAVYAREVVQRLQDQEGVLRASEHYRDDKTLPLPAQMFRMGAEATRQQKAGFTYALLSPWPLNPQNAPRTEAEKAGIQQVVATGQSSYASEVLGGQTYFTAVYPDQAVTEACVACHNAHRESPRRDFKVGDTMGGVVIRIPVD
jgi:Protein of unknown function (DUF3365)